jgi:hypothetical protein
MILPTSQGLCRANFTASPLKTFAMNISKITWVALAVMPLSMGSCSKTDPATPQSASRVEIDLKASQKWVSLSDGAALLNGNGSPAADVGANGDYYIDKTDAYLFGPKKITGWGDPTDLKAPKANMHKQGLDIDKTGAEQSSEGNAQFLSGTAVPEASNGNPGDYYLDIPDSALYGPKTTSGWGPGVRL